MSFKDAVRSAPEIADCLESGLQALGSYSKRIEINATRSLEGSVDIDTCVKNIYPQESRWDYVFGYKRRVYYVEVHPATTGEVKTIIAKLKWLKKWRKRSAPQLKLLNCSYHWISSGKTAITRGSKYSKMLAQAGIAGPYSRLNADKVSMNAGSK